MPFDDPAVGALVHAAPAQLDMKRVLVTGAAGFLGRAAVGAFAAQGYTVRAALRRRPAPDFPDGVAVVEHVQADWPALVAGIDIVVHLAGIERADRHVSGDVYDRVNRLATAELAAAAARSGVRQFVFVSSIRAQSGAAADHALTERDAPAPTDAQGRSKLDGEAVLRSAGVPFTILRPVPIYGPGMQGHLALLARAANSPWPLPMKNFANRRSLLGLDNFISALLFVVSSPAAIGETFVVADPGIPPALGDAVATLRRAQGRWPLLLPMPAQYIEVALRAIGRGDLWDAFGGNLRVDARKLIAAGWSPLHDTRAGLVTMAQQAGATTPVTPPVATSTPDRPQPQPD
jgi:UDP-glucose 4-epimerase